MNTPFSVTRTKPAPCPFCGTYLNAATPGDGDGATATPGDVTLCIGCAEVLVFDGKLQPVKPGPGELDATFAENPDLAAELTRGQALLRAAFAQGFCPGEKRAERRQ